VFFIRSRDANTVIVTGFLRKTSGKNFTKKRSLLNPFTDHGQTARIVVKDNFPRFYPGVSHEN
jgi:hypothetical protein